MPPLVDAGQCFHDCSKVENPRMLGKGALHTQSLCLFFLAATVHEPLPAAVAPRLQVSHISPPFKSEGTLHNLHGSGFRLIWAPILELAEVGHPKYRPQHLGTLGCLNDGTPDVPVEARSLDVDCPPTLQIGRVGETQGRSTHGSSIWGPFLSIPITRIITYWDLFLETPIWLQLPRQGFGARARLSASSAGFWKRSYLWSYC